MMERIDLESKTDIKNFQQGNAKLEILNKYTPFICAGIRYMRDYKINVILDKCNHFDVWSLLILEMFINYINDFQLIRLQLLVESDLGSGLTILFMCNQGCIANQISKTQIVYNQCILLFVSFLAIYLKYLLIY